MLYLVCHGSSAKSADYTDFSQPLTDGVAQATQICELAQRVQIQYIVSAPNRRSIDTTDMYRAYCRSMNKQCRSHVSYELSQQYLKAPHEITKGEIAAFGMNMQNVFGNYPKEVETLDEYHRRVIDWFSNQFFFRIFQDAPVPTMIVADPVTIAVISYYIMRNLRYEDVKPVVANLKPGSVLEFGSDGLQLMFTRAIM